MVKELIGKGKFGTVFLGENQNTKEKVAIKIEDTNSEISVLKNETRILEYLSRNGLRTQIPQVFWFGIYNDIHTALIMTYFVGKSLDEYVSLLNNDILINDWVVSAINILEKIHTYGVIHRDIKPAHFIFVEEKQKWVLIDFGFATFFANKSSDKSEYIIGTPNYISLNIHNGEKPTPIDDVWSIVYIYIRILLPELFIFTKPLDKEEKYPPNHILNIQNQMRKERKEWFNNPDFWEKVQKVQNKEKDQNKEKYQNKEKIIELIQLLSLSQNNIHYTKISNMFVTKLNKKQYK